VRSLVGLLLVGFVGSGCGEGCPIYNPGGDGQCSSGGGGGGGSGPHELVTYDRGAIASTGDRAYLIGVRDDDRGVDSLERSVMEADGDPGVLEPWNVDLDGATNLSDVRGWSAEGAALVAIDDELGSHVVELDRDGNTIRVTLVDDISTAVWDGTKWWIRAGQAGLTLRSLDGEERVLDPGDPTCSNIAVTDVDDSRIAWADCAFGDGRPLSVHVYDAATGAMGSFPARQVNRIELISDRDDAVWFGIEYSSELVTFDADLVEVSRTQRTDVPRTLVPLPGGYVWYQDVYDRNHDGELFAYDATMPERDFYRVATTTGSLRSFASVDGSSWVALFDNKYSLDAVYSHGPAAQGHRIGNGYEYGTDEDPADTGACSATGGARGSLMLVLVGLALVCARRRRRR
jgi:MYXO-CTERM domain-containing protein